MKAEKSSLYKKKSTKMLTTLGVAWILSAGIFFQRAEAAILFQQD